MSNSELVSIFKDDITEEGISELRRKYPINLVMDMSDGKNLTVARKIRTERNKLTEAINRRRLDKTKELKNIGDELIETVNEIYSVVVKPFEVEDNRLKEIAKAEAEKERAIIYSDRKKIDDLKGFVGQAAISNSEQISGMIDAIQNIDCSSFHKDLIHEAIEAKNFTSDRLGEALSSKLQSEQTERELDELKNKVALMEVVKHDAATDAEDEKIQDDIVVDSPFEFDKYKIEITINCGVDRANEIKKRLENFPEVESLKMTGIYEI